MMSPLSPIFLRVLLLVLLASLAACSDDNSDPAPADPPGEQEEGETDTPEPEPEPGGGEQSCVPDWMTYPHLLGSIHEHSGYSDGEIGTTPADYYQAGRDLGLDYMLGSDHSDNLRLPITASTDCLSAQLPECLQLFPPDYPLLGLTKWEETATLAAAATDDSFTAVRGFEWTSDRFGHINVFFSQNEINAKLTDGYLLSMEGFWFWFGFNPQIGGGADGLLVFNHPGREDMFHEFLGDPAYAFNGFEYREAVAERSVGVEVFGKSSDAYDTDNNAPPEGWYAFALDRGWRLGPVGAEDEHGREWARPERAKTVMIATDNQAETLKQAMLARRFYALAQHHNDIRLLFAADSEPMGSVYSPPSGTQVQLHAEVTAAMPAGGRLEIVSGLGEIVTSASGSKLNHIVDVTEDKRWYYLRVLDAEGMPVAYSSPVWLQAGDAVSSCVMD